MKLIAALALFVAAISALPSAEIDDRNVRLDQSVIDFFVGLSESIIERGLDPYHLRRESGSIGFPGGRLFTAAGLVEDVTLDGLSNIVINNVDYDVVAGRVNFDIQMPSVVGAVGYANGAVLIFGHNLEAEGSGSLAITDARVRGSVSVSYGVTGIVVTDANVIASIGNIASDISLDFQAGSRQYDLGQYINRFLNELLPQRLREYQDEINRLIAIYLVRYLNRN